MEKVNSKIEKLKSKAKAEVKERKIEKTKIERKKAFRLSDDHIEQVLTYEMFYCCCYSV